MNINILIGGYGFSKKFIEDRIEYKEGRKIQVINTSYIENYKEIYRYIKSPLNVGGEEILKDIYIFKFTDEESDIDRFIDIYYKNPIDSRNIQNYIFLVTTKDISKGMRISLDSKDINIIDLKECDFYIDLKKDISNYFIKKDINKCWDLLCTYCNNDYEKIKLDKKRLELSIEESGTKLNEYRLKQLYSSGINYNLISKYFRNKDNLEGLKTIDLMDDSTLYILMRSTKDRLSLIKKELLNRFTKETNKNSLLQISKKIIEINYIDIELTKALERKYKPGIIRFYSYALFILNK